MTFTVAAILSHSVIPRKRGGFSVYADSIAGTPPGPRDSGYPLARAWMTLAVTMSDETVADVLPAASPPPSGTLSPLSFCGWRERACG